MRVLITGRSGFVGRWLPRIPLAQTLADVWHEVAAQSVEAREA